MADSYDYMPDYQSSSSISRFSPYQHQFPSQNYRARGGSSYRGSRSSSYRGGRQARNQMRPRPNPETAISSSFAPVEGRVRDKPSHVSHEKKQAKPEGLLMYQVPTWYSIFCSNQGIRLLCSIYFENLQGRDQRMAQMITLLQFEYVVCLSFYYRLAVINRDAGNAGPYTELSDLRDAVKGIELPALLLRYLECIGLVKLPNEVTVGPYYSNDLQDNPLMISPQELLEEAGRIVPPGHWHIDRDWITEWNAHTTRASRKSFGFGKVDYTVHTGRPELTVSYQETELSIYQPRAPIRLSDEEAKLGACYSWRDYEQEPLWPGGEPRAVWGAFRGSQFNPALYYETLVVSSITSE